MHLLLSWFLVGDLVYPIPLVVVIPSKSFPSINLKWMILYAEHVLGNWSFGDMMWVFTNILLSP